LLRAKFDKSRVKKKWRGDLKRGRRRHFPKICLTLGGEGQQGAGGSWGCMGKVSRSPKKRKRRSTFSSKLLGGDKRFRGKKGDPNLGTGGEKRTAQKELEAQKLHRGKRAIFKTQKSNGRRLERKKRKSLRNLSKDTRGAHRAGRKKGSRGTAGRNLGGRGETFDVAKLGRK